MYQNINIILIIFITLVIICFLVKFLPVNITVFPLVLSFFSPTFKLGSKFLIKLALTF